MESTQPCSRSSASPPSPAAAVACPAEVKGAAMSHHLRLRESLLTVSRMMLALLPAVTATATDGVMYVTVDTALTEDHN